MKGETSVFLGVDVGSSSAKATAVDTKGTPIAHASRELTTTFPRPGWAEQNPEDWYDAACTAIRGCIDIGRFAPSDVAGLAFVGPAHNVALLGEDDRILRPTIHWSDVRSVEESKVLEETAGNLIFSRSGQPVNPSWTMSQLLWLQRNEPQVWRQIRKLLVTKDYVRHRFTNDYLTDPFDAAGTQLYDLGGGVWSEELCGLIDLDPSCLPKIQESNSIAGRLSEQAAQETGLPSGVPIAVGGSDSAVEAFGTGAVKAGDGVVKVGTSCCVNVITENYATSRQTLTYPYLFGGLGFTVAATTNGTSTLKWLRSGLLAHSKLSFDEIVQIAAAAAPGSDGLIFHPYLMGERTPYWDPRLRGGFVGLCSHHGIAELARALMEGVAFSMRDCLEALRAISIPVARFSLLGGGSKSTLWSQIIADVLQIELRKPAVSDASYGAALVAGFSVKAFPDWHAFGDEDMQNQQIVRPAAETSEIYEKYYQVFRKSVADMMPHYHVLHELAADEWAR